MTSLLHDPETGATHPVTLTPDPASPGVLVSSAERTLAVPASALSLSSGGWQGTAVHLVWERDGKRWAVTVDGPEDLSRLAAALPEPLAGQAKALVGAAERGLRRGTQRTAIVLSLFVLLPLLLVLAAWVFRERILDAAMKRLPTSVDAQVGQLVFQQVSTMGDLVTSGPAVEAVQSLGARLAKAAPPHPHDLRFFVVRDPSVNAFAAPGGVVVVHTGLLAAASGPDPVAGVLAHEITHVLQRHSMRQIAFRTGLGGAMRLLFGSPDGAYGVLTGAASDLTSLGFSRAQERDADRGGLDLLQRARLPGEGLVRFFEVLEKQGGAPPALLSSHPPSAERSRELAEEMRRRGDWPLEPLEIDWAAVKAHAAPSK